MRSADLRRSRIRLRLAQGILLLAFLGLGARAAQLCLFNERAAERAAAQAVTVLRLPPERGLIVDRNGAELALSIEAPSVYAVPRAVQEPEATAAALARVLGLDARRVVRQLQSRNPFVYLARWVGAAQAQKIRELRLPGIAIVHERRRSYPYQLLAAPLIGFANIDGVGVRGVEQLEDAWLRGSPQRVPVERDARGRLLAGPGLEPHQSAGGDVALSLDVAFQADAENALQDALASTGARGGFVVCLEPHSGEVLALAERPAFDPNRFRSLPYTETRSRVFLDAFEPGSTLKPFLIAAALEAGAVSPDELIDLEGGSLRVPGKWIRDRHAREALDVGGILRVSSNVGAVKVAQRLGAKHHFDALKRFGFGSSTRSRFPEESAGLLRSWRDWKPIDHATIAFGQGIGVTAIQLAVATAALANGGFRRAPRLVVARRSPGGAWEPARGGAPARRAVPPEVARQLLTMMEGVVGPGGTGERAALADVRVAGKTGTVEKLDPVAGTYGTNRYLAWFAGVAPGDAPKIVVVVGLDEPRRPAHTGGTVAAPLFARVAAAHLTRLGIPTQPARAEGGPPALRPTQRQESASERVGGVRSQSAAAAHEAPRKKGSRRARASSFLGERAERTLLPDFRGLTIDEVQRMTAGTPLVLELSGAGFAVEQDPEPGTILGGETQRVRVRFASEEREG